VKIICDREECPKIIFSSLHNPMLLVDVAPVFWQYPWYKENSTHLSSPFDPDIEKAQ
jgi:hypothetical protein